MPLLPFRRWPQDATDLSITRVRAMYRDGYAGCETRPEKIAAADGEFVDWIESQGDWSRSDGESAAYANGLVGTGEGKLTVLSHYIEQIYPGSLPGPPQQRGDCVSHSNSVAALATIVGESISGQPDEISGEVESAPEVSPDGVRAGVISSCYTYWFRGYNGDGWQCSLAAKTCANYGVMLCKKYSDDLDLSNYSSSLAGKYGKRSPPSDVIDIGRQHLIRTATRVSGYEQIRDFISNSYGISTCGGESWSSVRDECGVSKRTRKGWSHAVGLIGVDDRDAVKRRYNTVGLCLLINSWGRWNSGSRSVMNSDLEIPAGSWWTRYEDMENRSCYALSSVRGWPPKKLPAIMENW